MEKHKEIFVALKRIVMAVTLRNSALTSSCPNLVSDEEEMTEKLKEVAKAQKVVDETITSFRKATEGRFNGFSNAEIAIIAHTWGGIWACESSLRVSSTSIMEIIGINEVEEAGELIVSLLDKSSRLFKFISIHWVPGRHDVGEYDIQLHDVDGLNRLILGNLSAPSKE